MLMDEGLDTGPVLMTERVPVGPRTTAAELHDRLAALGARMIVAALAGRASGTLTPMPQPAEGVTYASKLAREEGRLDWSRPAAALDRLVRAFTPWPGAWFAHRGERIKVLAAEPAPGSGRAGEVLDGSLTVACGEGALRLTRLQRAGKGPLDSASFVRGFPLPAGTVLEPAA
jgi:methionyl-tRNA formyltransferase